MQMRSRLDGPNYLVDLHLMSSPAEWKVSVLTSQVAIWYTCIRNRLQYQRNEKQCEDHVGVNKGTAFKKRVSFTPFCYKLGIKLKITSRYS